LPACLFRRLVRFPSPAGKNAVLRKLCPQEYALDDDFIGGKPNGILPANGAAIKAAFTPDYRPQKPAGIAAARRQGA
jgi:hypothetical protein